ncbi:extracellular catalytic domain type 1 short-chain-length polyhydroxyalkanoate depolymerase [Brumimicrobium aurantiacum]|uniref:T9SS C-terminal target domain-containing protein n=1 Tax=Brumimicrobium aurantiacum TaxID=1737063 RepID=A0A3E1EVF5_9FLAO|nr:T9SS type A sorting domain-containing protein [Brumimicrobium aurantiacum]RFC53544.1 T9SS C-terminal target domain-containing protein [Brumimicrobium aurantiacum]
MKQILFFLSVLTAAFSIAQTGTQSTSSIQHDGKTREYILYVPQMYDGQTAVPLVLNLHGLGSSMNEQIIYGEFREIADTANFILVTPNGLLNTSNQRHWNFFVTNGEDDLGFLSKLIDSIAGQYAIDEDRVYSTGMSNGGFMSYHLACELEDKITAVASVTGTMIANQAAGCNPTKPIPTMLIHGTNDPVVPYGGNGIFLPVDDVLNHWIGIAGADETPIMTPVPDIDNTDGCTAEHYLYANGTNGATVEHYKIIGGGHSWPGALVDVDVTNHDFDASIEIWRFFRQYNSADLLSIADENKIDNTLKIYPNPSTGAIQIETDQKVDKIDVVNTQGKTVATFKNIQKSLEISNLNNGVYFVKIHSEEKVVTKKVIVQ